jgi:Zn-dependent peptidase ImmA (M78 family)
MIDYSKIRIPFLSKGVIKKHADSFRCKSWNDSLPVDIEKIIDLKLKIDIIPIPDLMKICNVDALISSDYESIYVDHDGYLDDKYQNRLRFSLSHEIGHYILHQEIYKSFKIKNFANFYKAISAIPNEQYGYLETQANKFANFLLVPRQKLIAERDRLILKYKEIQTIKDRNSLNSYLAIPLSNIFGVSSEVVEIALNEL